MTPERSEIQWGLTRIPFVIKRSEKRSTVALTIEERGKLLVTAPSAVPIETLNAIVRRKATWVAQRMRAASDLPAPLPAREFVSGETVLYLGRQLRLAVIAQAEARAPRLWRGWYEVPIPPGLREDERGREVRRRLAGALEERAQHILPRRLDEICTRLGLDRPVMLLREPQKRWGSCDAGGTLRINWRIIQAPPALIDYVLVHELVHREHRQHGPAFWAALGRHLPDYERRREALRQLGEKLVW